MWFKINGKVCIGCVIGKVPGYSDYKVLYNHGLRIQPADDVKNDGMFVVIPNEYIKHADIVEVGS